MPVRSYPRLVRPGTAVRLALLAAGIMIALLVVVVPAQGADGSAFRPGVVDVDVEGGAITPVDLTELDGESAGMHTAREILRFAANTSGDFTFDDFWKIEIWNAKAKNFRSYTGKLVRKSPGNTPTFLSKTDATYVVFPGGPKVKYSAEGTDNQNLTPKITVLRNDEDIDVTLTSSARTIKSGETVKFRAKVSGATGAREYRWSFGDGKTETTSSGKISHRFKGSDKTFMVILTVTASGNERRGEASALITIGKSKKKPVRKKRKKDNGKDGPPNSSDPGNGGYGDPYGDGYGDGYGSGYGDDYGSGAPGPATPAPSGPPATSKPKKPRVAVDDGLLPVRGELLDPSIPAEVIAPATEQPSTATEVSPAEADSGGFGLSGGAMTAIGIGVLLGLGGFTELRAFTRFR